MGERQTVNKVQSQLTQEVLESGERQLLALALSSDVSQEQLDEFLKGWDIEAAPFPSVILLSYLMKTHPELSFPDSIMPRLKGVLNYCRFQNIKLYANFARIAGRLNSLEIPFVILKGGAMKAYRPDFPRWMGDIDILVRERDFHKAAGAVEELGFSPFRCAHSWDFRVAGTEESALDLHKFIQMNTGKEQAYNEGLFARSSAVKVATCGCLLPSREDMVFISLVNLYRNLSDKTSTGSVLNTFTDLHYLLGNGESFYWDTVWDSARKTGTEIQICVAAAFVSNLLPQSFPKEFLSDWMDRKEAERDSVELLYQREIISPLRAEIGVSDLIKAIKSVRPFGPYIRRRIKLFFLKRVSPAARKRILTNKGFI